jgi:hypothetical protein
MSIIKKGVNKIGTYYIKKCFTRTLGEAGAEEVLAAFIFPEYTHPGYMWVDYAFAGNADVDPQEFAEAYISGRMGAMARNHDISSMSDSYMLDLAELYLPYDQDSVSSITATATDVGITGGEFAMPAGKNLEFYRRDFKLGLGHSAYPSAAGAIRYAGAGKWKGDVRTKTFAPIDQPKLLQFLGTSSVPSMGNNWATIMAGGNSTTIALYEELVSNIPSRNEPRPYATSQALTSGIEDFIKTGYAADTMTDSETIHCRMYVSIRLDIYEPEPGSTIVAP